MISHDRRRPVDQSTAIGGPIIARYDAAQSTDTHTNHWAAVDALDADSANSKGVRKTLVERSRYETGSNAYVDAIIQLHADYVVGTGPKLRMKTKSKTFNRMVEKEFSEWVKATHFRRKLWTMCHAKCGDGEGMGIMSSNPRHHHAVSLDVALIETEQCTTPYLPHGTPNYIDGIRFDEFDNPLWYDVLPYHPGGQWYVAHPEPDPIPASSMLHWFGMRRPMQHRGVPELKSSLNVGAGSRRWREATVSAAETAAEISVLLKTQMSPDQGADPVSAFTTLDWQKNLMMSLPGGWEAGQMRGEHPNATYEAFHRAQVSEQGRPKSMPHNLAAGDSSDHNFASGKVDYTPYYKRVDVEREDGNDLVLNPLFRTWWFEAQLRFGWISRVDQFGREIIPAHGWDWPEHPVADETAKAAANEKRVKTGQATLSAIYAESGRDFEDEIATMATDFGMSEDEVRQAIFMSYYNEHGALSAMAQVQVAEKVASQPQPKAST